MSLTPKSVPPLADDEWLGFRCPYCGREQPALDESGKPLDRGASFACTGCGEISTLTFKNTGREKL